MSNTELLSAISDLLDEKLEQKLEQKLEEKLEAKLEAKFEEKLTPVYQRLDQMDHRLDQVDHRLDQVDLQMNQLEKLSHTTRLLLENDVLPRLQNIEACYTETAKRYLDRIRQIDTLQSDMDVLKRVVHTHSCALQSVHLLPT